VLIQIPTYNEPRVVGRVLDAVSHLDWPGECLQVQVLDDSTDDTPVVADDAIERLKALGLQAELRHRANRGGFKAGALQQGLSASHAPFVAILDADYVPSSGWLRACMEPLLRDDGLAFVQSRIDFLNRTRSWFTRGQSVLLDIHYVIEQGGRDSVGLVVPFNGTCGIWRRQAIDAVGGWYGDTLVEDMDLSFRVAAAGWQSQYLLDVSVPGELPEHVRDWIGQQKRWSMGTAQVTRQKMRQIVSRSTSSRIRLSLLYQLLNIFAGQVSILALITGILFLVYASQPASTLVGIVAVALLLILARAVAMPVIASSAIGRLSLRGALVDIPCFIAVTVLGALFGGAAAVRGLLGHPAPFVRTRKTGAISGE
jgi:cellulose synthase/poly-beta-1,6-N-acetylglucosamine synthase-like glycosyltransferase